MGCRLAGSCDGATVSLWRRPVAAAASLVLSASVKEGNKSVRSAWPRTGCGSEGWIGGCFCCPTGWFDEICSSSENDCALEPCGQGETCVDCNRGKFHGSSWVANEMCPDGYHCHPGRRRLQFVGAGTNAFFTSDNDQRRLQISYHGADGCSFGTFDTRIADMNTACCDQDDRDDVCDTGIPQTCDVECASTFHDFFRDWHHLPQHGTALHLCRAPAEHSHHAAPTPTTAHSGAPANGGGGGVGSSGVRKIAMDPALLPVVVGLLFFFFFCK